MPGGRTVALVDDDAAVRSLISRVLKTRLGVDVVEGGDGLDAVRLRFAEPPPVAVVVNGHRPRMGGIAAIRRREAAEGRLVRSQ